MEIDLLSERARARGERSIGLSKVSKGGERRSLSLAQMTPAGMAQTLSASPQFPGLKTSSILIVSRTQDIGKGIFSRRLRRCSALKGGANVKGA